MQDNMNDINENGMPPFISFDKAWAGLKPELDAEAKRREKRKKRFIIFWISLIAIGLGGGFVLYNNGNKTTNNVEQNIAKREKLSDAAIENNKHQLTTIKQGNPTKNDVSENSFIKPEILKREQNSHVNKQVENIDTRKTESKKQFVSRKANTFEIIKIYTNINQYKKDNNLTATISIATKHPAINNNTSNESIASNATNTIDSTLRTKDSVATKVAITSNENKLKKASNQLKKTNNIHYGLQWNVPVQDGVNSLDINASKQPATLFIPQVWVSKNIGKKSSLLLSFNPNSQYYFNNKAVVDNSKFDIIIHQGSQAGIKPETIVYTETTAFNKLISIEAALMYQYQLSSKIKIGLGISSNWIQGALLQNKVIRNFKQVTRDSLYGVNKDMAAWSYLNSSFMLGKFDFAYKIKKLELGICFSTPVTSIFKTSHPYNSPINTNLFLRWTIR